MPRFDFIGLCCNNKDASVADEPRSVHRGSKLFPLGCPERPHAYTPAIPFLSRGREWVFAAGPEPFRAERRAGVVAS